MTRIRRLGTPLVAAACLIAGIVIGRAIPHATDRTSTASDQTGGLPHATRRSPGRNVYSPDIRHDEFVVQEQRKLVEMLEHQCRASGENCDLAKASREALTRE